MPTPDQYITAMIDALDPQKLKEFATAQGLELETLRVGFIAYVRRDSTMTDEENGRIFDAFIERAREVYLKQRVH